MINLPEWKLTLCPPLYDTSSKSQIEQTAQVYAKMRELIEAYNQFTADMLKAMNDFITSSIQGNEEFEKCINKTMQDYIESIDTKIDLAVNEMLEKYKQEVKDVAEEAVTEVLNSGEVTLTEHYDEATESLYFVLGV